MNADLRAGRQRGIATLLILLLLGLAMTVTVLGAVHALRGNQQRQLGTHADAAARAAAWRGVETLRQTLLQTDAARLLGWSGLATGAAWSQDCDGGGTALDLPLAGMAGLQIGDARLTGICRAATQGAYRITARVTGCAGNACATVPANRLATATVEVVYEVAPGGTSSVGSTTCAALPASPLILNGDVTYTGGGLSVTDSSGSYDNVAISGDLTISSGSTAKISGCVKGDVTLSGGGITDNGHLYSEGTITISHMSSPSGTTLWAKSIKMTQDGGSYTAIKAGGYAVSVVSGGSAVGTSVVGGTLLASTVSTPSVLPWTQGTLVPMATGEVVITLNDGSEYLLDMSTASIDAASGEVSNAGAAELLSGHGDSPLPASFHFVATVVYGGDIGIMQHTVGTLWGHTITASGWGGSYTNLWSNGDLKLTGNGAITNLVGGGWMWVVQAGGVNSGSASNMPTIASGKIAGQFYFGSGKTQATAAVSGLSTGQSGTTPGLPGVPYCDTRVTAVDADDYKASANYVFEFVDGVHWLTIHNVKNSAGTSIDGSYDLDNPNSSQKTLLQALLACSYGNDKGCLDSGADDGSWTLRGVTKMPSGVLWFDGDVTVDGSQVDLLDTVVSKGDITLTKSGHQKLYAPNFSTPALVCGGSYYPTNLCTKSSGTWAFTNWTDSGGSSHVGLPIANSAIIAEGSLTAQGWTIYGNVLLGEQFATGANTTTIHGSMTVGANQSSQTTVSQGGLAIVVPVDNDNQYLPTCSTTSETATSGGLLATIRWSRYL